METIEYCQKMSDEAYEQERDREKKINIKADYLFRWLTLFVGVFNIAVPIIVKESEINYNDFYFRVLYILLMVLIVGAMLIIVILNMPKKVKIYPSGSDILREIQKNADKNGNKVVLAYQNVLYKDILTKRLARNNDRAIVCITIVNVMLLIALICLAIFFGYITWGM